MFEAPSYSLKDAPSRTGFGVPNLSPSYHGVLTGSSVSSASYPHINLHSVVETVDLKRQGQKEMRLVGEMVVRNEVSKIGRGEIDG